MSQEIYSQYRTHVHYVETVFESILIPAIFTPHMCCFPFAYGTTLYYYFQTSWSVQATLVRTTPRVTSISTITRATALPAPWLLTVKVNIAVSCFKDVDI